MKFLKITIKNYYDSLKIVTLQIMTPQIVTPQIVTPFSSLQTVTILEAEEKPDSNTRNYTFDAKSFNHPKSDTL